jgi:MYXO-CTERM domain-containing protein
MLAIVVAAGLTPETGVVRASTNCTYGTCPASTPFPVWAVATTVAVVLLALLLALLLLRRRRRPPAAAPPPEWEGPAGPGGPDAGAGAGTVGVGAAVPAWQESPPSPAPEAGPMPEPEAPSETEAAEGIPPAAAMGSMAAAAPPAPEAEPDIDSLMSELDKISEEILKRPPKKPATDSGGEGEPSSDDST